MAITGTEGADTLSYIMPSYGDAVFVNALGGRDLIYLSAKNQYTYSSGGSVDAGDGNDTIVNRSVRSGGDTCLPFHHISINGGAGDDSIQNGSSYVSASYVTLEGGSGKDTIRHYGSNSLIDGGDGDDYIFNSGIYSITIIGGKGNDSITNGESNCINTPLATATTLSAALMISRRSKLAAVMALTPHKRAAMMLLSMSETAQSS